MISLEKNTACYILKALYRDTLYRLCAGPEGGGGPDHPPWKIHTFLYKIAIGPPFPRNELEPPGK